MDKEVQHLPNKGKGIMMEEDTVLSTMTKTETEEAASDSISSNSPPQTERATTSNIRPQRQHGNSSSRSQRQHGNSSSRYKGVVPQQNGHWGAQIYAYHQRKWLGTFKTEVDAAAAYDSAAIKLRPDNGNDPHRNFPVNPYTAHEPTFQAQYTTAQVLNMIKDGSYKTKFAEFLSSIISQRSSSQTSAHCGQSRKEGYFYEELFRKELTTSDVGKLNRLVIPKRYALKYFPKIDQEGEGGGDIELMFYDRSMRGWKFRYCYWKSSQSFVFTRGWNKFVQEKMLKDKDIVVFYICEYRENNGKDVKRFSMIDIVVYEEVKEPNATNSRVGHAEDRQDSLNDNNEKKGKVIKLFGKEISYE